jgi:hypothetical protein
MSQSDRNFGKPDGGKALKDGKGNWDTPSIKAEVLRAWVRGCALPCTGGADVMKGETSEHRPVPRPSPRFDLAKPCSYPILTPQRREMPPRVMQSFRRESLKCSEAQSVRILVNRDFDPPMVETRCAREPIPILAISPF